MAHTQRYKNQSGEEGVALVVDGKVFPFAGIPEDQLDESDVNWAREGIYSFYPDGEKFELVGEVIREI